MLKVMEWDVYVEKDMQRRSMKVWVETLSVNPDERLNLYFKDGEMLSQVRKIQNVMPDGLIPMFAGPMDMMKEVIEKMAEAYPSKMFVKSTVYDEMHYELTKKAAGLQSELKEEKVRFERVFEAYMKVTSEGQPIMATLENTVDASTTLSNQEEPNALVDTFSFGWRDLVGYLFAGAVCSGIMMAAGRAFRLW
jgi:hypothetical protein